MAKDQDKIEHSSGTYYSPETPERVIELLEWARRTDTRIRVHYGYTEASAARAQERDGRDAEAGQDWGDVYDVAGRVGRSMGPIKIPILLSNNRSHGGGAMLDDCIVRIRFANKREGGDLYVHPEYKPPSRVTHDYPDYDKHFPAVNKTPIHLGIGR